MLLRTSASIAMPLFVHVYFRCTLGQLHIFKKHLCAVNDADPEGHATSMGERHLFQTLIRTLALERMVKELELVGWESRISGVDSSNGIEFERHVYKDLLRVVELYTKHESLCDLFKDIVSRNDLLNNKSLSIFPITTKCLNITKGTWNSITKETCTLETVPSDRFNQNMNSKNQTIVATSVNTCIPIQTLFSKYESSTSTESKMKSREHPTILKYAQKNPSSRKILPKVTGCVTAPAVVSTVLHTSGTCTALYATRSQPLVPSKVQSVSATSGNNLTVSTEDLKVAKSQTDMTAVTTVAQSKVSKLESILFSSPLTGSMTTTSPSQPVVTYTKSAMTTCGPTTAVTMVTTSSASNWLRRDGESAMVPPLPSSGHADKVDDLVITQEMPSTSHTQPAVPMVTLVGDQRGTGIQSNMARRAQDWKQCAKSTSDIPVVPGLPLRDPTTTGSGDTSAAFGHLGQKRNRRQSNSTDEPPCKQVSAAVMVDPSVVNLWNYYHKHNHVSEHMLLSWL